METIEQVAGDEVEVRSHLPDVLPVLPLRETTLFPMAIMPLVVGQPRSVLLIDDVMRGDRTAVFVTQKTTGPEQAGPDDLYAVGTAGTVRQLFRAPDGTLRLLVQGLERVRLGEFTETEPYLRARIEPIPEALASGVEVDALRRAVVDLFRGLAGLTDGVSGEVLASFEALTDPAEVANFVASTLQLTTPVRQELLELDPLDARLRKLVDLLQHELAVGQLSRRIATETEQRLSKAQREVILREQIRAIQAELAEEGDVAEFDQLRARFDQAGLPDDARKEVDRELGRLATIPAASPEHGMIRTYLDWMVSLPWNVLSGGTIDVPHAREVLDDDHYDLDKVKDRILEHLAVQKLRQERFAAAGEAGAASREPVLCFVGPPGVGKTSLGQSIARALGKKFVRVSLGGVHDEAEIRGHRRTYIGALPGRIIQALRRAETRDPVFLLDEIDKLGSDWRGDPSYALLEVLDPAQNHTFTDNYLGVSFDLSKVLFLATANTLDTIPGPLLDRMETLHIAGYTEEEKRHIARRYLVPKQLAAHGLRSDELAVDDDALQHVIRSYTREAGVRNLDRELASICRKVARDIAEGKPVEPVTPTVVEQYLGRPRFSDEVAERVTRPGVATGLAWTPVGGDVLFVEATIMPSGQEQLILTGQLGEVMRESAQAALSFLRSEARALGIDPDAFTGKTVHIHVPAGAVPKDGPSAGVTMLTALASVATARPVRGDVAMTGEITLRGKVLPVGGIKEKVLAAHRLGIRTVILPRRNERDIEDVPADARLEMHFVFVDTAADVLSAAFEAPVEAPVTSPA